MTTRFSAVIIDDEPLAVEGVRRLLQLSSSVELVGEAHDGVTGLELIARVRPQAVFLDIAMPGLTGLEVAAFLARMPHRPLVVFVTANDHYATDAFDLAVVDYVLKPIVPERLKRAIERVSALAAADIDASAAGDFWLPHRGSMVRLTETEIHRVEAERDYVRIIAADRSFLLRATMGDIFDRLDPNRFVRIHRSTIVPRDRVGGLRHAGAGAWVVLDVDGPGLPIGRSYLESVRTFLRIS